MLGTWLLSLLKFFAVPGSLSFLAFCLVFGLGLIYIWPRRRLGRMFLLGVGIVYVVLALPVVANAIADRLPRYQSSETEPVGTLDALVVFDGDNRRGRVRAAAEAYKATPARRVVVLGGVWMIDPIAEAGVPRDRITWDGSTPTTRDQIAWVKRLSGNIPEGRIAVVASRLQMPRIALLIEASRVPAVLIASPVDTEPPVAGWQTFLPTYTALRVSRDAIYEKVALAYYQWRGWL